MHGKCSKCVYSGRNMRIRNRRRQKERSFWSFGPLQSMFPLSNPFVVNFNHKNNRMLYLYKYSGTRVVSFLVVPFSGFHCTFVVLFLKSVSFKYSASHFNSQRLNGLFGLTAMVFKSQLGFILTLLTDRQLTVVN